MNRGRSLTVSLAAVSLALAGWLISSPVRGQSSQGNPFASNLRGDRDGNSSPDGESERDDIRGREQWFYRQRRYPLPSIPWGVRLGALARKQVMRRAQRELSLKAPAAGARTLFSPQMMASTSSWTSIGPTPTAAANGAIGSVSGRITALAVDPTNSSILYAGGAQGGVWKTIDAGAHWQTTFDSENTLAIGSLAIDPSSCSPGPCSTLYVGTGEQNFSGDSYYGAGVYVSTDAGTTWSQVPMETITNPQPGAPTSFLPPAVPFNQAVGGVHIGALAIHPATPARLFAAVQIFENVGGGASSGLYCSDDGGMSWRQLLSGAIGTDVAIHPAGMVGYAALGSNNGDSAPAGGTPGNNGIYKSTNVNLPCSSQVWTLVSKAPLPLGTSAGTIHLSLARSDAAANTLYAAVANPIQTTAPFNTTLAGVFKTVNGGSTWTSVTPPRDFCMNQCDYDMAIQVHPTDPNTVFLGGSAVQSGNMPYFLLRTNNGGATWTQIAQDSNGTLLHVDQHAIAFGFSGANVTTLYVGNDGGVWSSPLAAASNPVSWTNLNSTLQLSQFYPGISMSPASPDVAFGGTQDNGTQIYNAASTGLQWIEAPACGDGGYTAIDPSNPSTVYTACQMIEILKSTNGGSSFSIADSGINQNDRSEFIPPMVIDPNPATSSRLYFGTYRVWQTVNRAASWTAISPDLTAGPANSPDITSLSVSPLNSDVVYAGTFDSKLWRTTNASAGSVSAWVELDAGTLPPRAITQVAADPNNLDTVFVTVSGFSGFQINPPATDTKGHVFRCSATHFSCSDISGTGAGALPNIPVNAIVIDPLDALSETLYIGTDVGVFASTDGGASWQPDFPGAPNGLPNVAVLSLVLHSGSRILRSGTHGRGAWDLQLTNMAPLRLASLAPASATVNTAGLTLTITGGGFTPSSTVLFNNVIHVPVSQSASQLTINLTAADLSSIGMVNVQVSDPTASPTLSNLAAFSITNDFGLCISAGGGMSCAATASGSATRGSAVPASLTISPVQSAAYPGNVLISCSGLPAESSCVFSSTAAGFTGGTTGVLPATAGAAGSAQITVMFTTTAPSLVSPRGGEPRAPGDPRPVLHLLWAGLLLALALGFAPLRRRTSRLRWTLAIMLILALVGLAGACGGGPSSSGGGGGGGGGGGNPGTPQGTFPIVVTASSANVTHSVSYSLTVQ